MEQEKKLILPFDDFDPTSEEGIKELEDEKLELEKATRDHMEDALKVADEINGDEHTEAIPEEPKLETESQIKESKGLILPEPSSILNEELNQFDYDDFLSDVYNAIADVCFKYNQYDLTREDIEQALEWFELHFFDQFSDEDYFEEGLDEALPRDLSKAYRSAYDMLGGNSTANGYKNIAGKALYKRPLVDFQNSNYTEITPEEAKAIRKAGDASMLRVIFDGQLITFNDKGEQRIGNYAAVRSYGSDTNKYTKTKNGKVVDKTNDLNFNEVVDRADKIYLVDEKNIDTNLMNQRAQNPESPYDPLTKANYDLIGKNRDSLDRYYSGWRWSSFNRVQEEVNNLKDLIAKYTESRDNATDTLDRDRYQGYIDRYTSQLNDLIPILTKFKSKEKDKAARNRYLASERDLMEPFKQFKELKDSVNYAQRQLNQATNKYNNLKANGSDDAKYYRRQLISYNSQLKDLMRSIARYEILLQDEEAKGSAQIDAAAEEMANMQNEMDRIKSELDKLLRRD